MGMDFKFIIIILSCVMISTISYPTSSEKLYDDDDDQFRFRHRKDTDVAMTLKRRAALERDPKPYAELEEEDYERERDHGRTTANFRTTSYEDRMSRNRRRHDVDARRYDDRYGRESPESFGNDRRNERAEEELRIKMRREDPVKSSDVDFGRRQHKENSESREKEIHSFSEKEQDKKNYQKMDCDRTHERFESCFAGCAAVTCDNPRERLRPCYPFCEPGCVCVEPWVRDDRTHKCVLLQECTRGLRGIPDLRP